MPSEDDEACRRRTSQIGKYRVVDVIYQRKKRSAELLSRTKLFVRLLMMSFREYEAFYVRNLDNLFVVRLVLFLRPKTRIKLLYEILDLHNIQLGYFKNLVRYVETGILLRKVHCVVLSSPGFTSYYEGLPTRIIENKLQNNLVVRHKKELAFEDSMSVITIGYCGVLRCKRSLEILSELLEYDDIRISIFGYPIPPLAQSFEHFVNLKNVSYGGVFGPGDLSTIYSGFHFSWCADFYGGRNSEILLPNRLYESGAAGVYCIARTDTVTGDYVYENGLGVVDSLVDVCSLRTKLKKFDRSGPYPLEPQHFVETNEIQLLVEN